MFMGSTVDKTFRKIGVDAGLIVIADRDFYRKYDGRVESDFSELGKRFKLPKGKYNVEWFIANTYHGNVSGIGSLKVTSGDCLVCDPCYVIHDYSQWDKVLADTNYFKKPPVGIVVLDKMGGDGTYRVHAGFTLMSKVNPCTGCDDHPDCHGKNKDCKAYRDYIA